MPIITLTLLPITFLCMVIATIMILVCKRSDVSTKDVYWQGSFIYRDLDKYVQSKFIKPIMILTYLGVGCFIVAVYGGLLSYMVQA